RIWMGFQGLPDPTLTSLWPSLRYYYNKRILHKTKGKRFTYKFNFNKLVMPNYPFINIRPNGESEAPPGAPCSQHLEFWGLDGLLKPPPSPTSPLGHLGQAGLAAGEALSGGFLPFGHGCGHLEKRKAEIMLPLFSRPGIYPDPHSPFAVSPLPGRGGVLNVPISPALSLTPTLFSYSPSPGLSPFTGSSCFSFNPEEMKHYLHSQACSVFNYHLSPRTFPRYPLMVPPLQCQMPLEEQPQFPIKLQPPPVGRKNRERLESAEDPAAAAAASQRSLASPPPPPPPPPTRVKVEPAVDKEAEPEELLAKGKEKNEREEGPNLAGSSEEEKGPVFARPAAPSWHPAPLAPSAQLGFSAEEGQEQGESSGGEKPARDSGGEAGGQEKREDALMPPKLRLKRRWNGDRQADGPEERPNGRLHWNGALGSPHLQEAPRGHLQEAPKALPAASDT
ncbi:ETV3 protein, partial [Indicator maculatus]|nr:ETV3 protein [Indicator maculatus]